MKLLVFGSLNIDHTYRLPHLVRPGETIASSHYRRSEGGKGFNQAAALALAGQEVFFAGAMGPDGLFLKEYLQSLQVRTDFLRTLDAPTGHAIIQVDEAGQNAILLFGGANALITREMIDDVLTHFAPGDWLLMQNEISGGDHLIRAAHARGMHVVLNPSPMSPELLSWPLDQVEWLLLNEVEGGDITGRHDPDAILDGLLRRFPDCRIVLTLGADGSVYADARQRIRQAAIPANAIDTTAAGDAFTGYLLRALLRGDAVGDALRLASHAAAIAVSRPGASRSIPRLAEVEGAMGHNLL